MPADEDFNWFESISYPNKGDVIVTKSSAWHKLPYTNTQSRAWRNAMVAAINEGIRTRLFTIRPGDNRWPSQKNEKARVFRFILGDIPAVATVSDIGYDELSIHCAFWPTATGEKWIGACGAGFDTGEVLSTGWLERKDGAWLPFNSAQQLNCRKNRLAYVAALDISANGYGDRCNLK
ncbi:MAG: hypothetical protein EXR27_18110 [Betaproteobacteria bacterium]|nr:hypothetical protein [Betaproteobacteria bacterium]